MNSSPWIGESYYLDPNNIVFDTEISTFNHRHSDKEYEATRTSIEGIGQERPIQINGRTDLCEDGVHRVRVAIELGIKILCRKINPELSFEERLLFANQNTTSGRDYTTSQKAIQALKLSEKTNIKANKAAIIFKVDSRQVSYAATIKGLGRSEMLDSIMAGEPVFVNGKPTTSLRKIASVIKAEEEDVIENTDERIEINYNDYIKTEAGKIKFWELVETRKGSLSDEIYKALVEYVNITRVAKKLTTKQSIKGNKND